MFVDSFVHHLTHPFTLKEKNLKLQVWERKVAVAGLALSIFGVVPGLIFFYLATLFFKNRCVTQLSGEPEAPITKVSLSRFNANDRLSASICKSCSWQKTPVEEERDYKA